MHMKKALAPAAVLCALILAAPAHAGTAGAPPVTVFDDGSGATGSLLGARNSADANQFIECSSFTNSQSGQIEAQCEARSASGATFSCSSTDPKILAAVQSISESSFVSVASDSNGKCRYVFVANSSRFLP